MRALTVNVKALHCLMLNTSFCISRLRGLCVFICACGGGRGGIKGRGVSLHAEIITAHKSPLERTGGYVQNDPYLYSLMTLATLIFSRIYLFEKPMIWKNAIMDVK